MKIWIIGLVAFVAGATAGIGGNAVFCHQYRPWSGDPARRASWMVRMLARDLQLSPDQSSRLNGMKDDLLRKRTEMAGGRAEMHRKLVQQIAGEKISEQTLNGLFDGRIEDMRKARVFMISRFVEFHSMLTAAQRQTLAKKVDEFHQMHEPFF